MVVVVGQRLHHLRRTPQAGAGSDEDVLGPGGDEAIDELLSQAEVDLGDGQWRELSAVEARVVDVDIEPVLVRGVTRGPVADAEVPAPGAAEVADGEPGRGRVGGAKRARDPQHAPYQVGRPEAAPPAVRGALQDRVPGEKVATLAGELHAAYQAPVVRQ